MAESFRLTLLLAVSIVAVRSHSMAFGSSAVANALRRIDSYHQGAGYEWHAPGPYTSGDPLENDTDPVFARTDFDYSSWDDYNYYYHAQGKQIGEVNARTNQVVTVATASAHGGTIHDFVIEDPAGPGWGYGYAGSEGRADFRFVLTPPPTKEAWAKAEFILAGDVGFVGTPFGIASSICASAQGDFACATYSSDTNEWLINGRIRLNGQAFEFDEVVSGNILTRTFTSTFPIQTNAVLPIIGSATTSVWMHDFSASSLVTTSATAHAYVFYKNSGATPEPLFGATPQWLVTLGLLRRHFQPVRNRIPHVSAVAATIGCDAWTMNDGA